MEPGSRGRASERAFTLIELVIVVVVLAFLASLLSTVVRDLASARSEYAGGLVARVVELAGAPLLLFGGAFWYAVELSKPGRLDTFRAGHFLLLALTFSLFFAVFAVLGSNEVDASLAVAIAAAVSLPLLTLHVATIVDFRFAWTSALPLAVASYGVVVNGVYGGEARSYVYLAMVSAAIAYLTLTYPRLAAGHEARRRELERDLEAAVAALGPEAAGAREAAASAQQALSRDDPVERRILRSWVEGRHQRLVTTLERHEQMLAQLDAVHSATRTGERRLLCRAAIDSVQGLQAQLPQARAALLEAVQSLAEGRRNPRAVLALATATPHCIACGHAVERDARFCPACGRRNTEPRSCPSCREILLLPVHLLPPAGDGEVAPATHCHACGERHSA